jgi:hypothetical protein
MIGAAAAIRLSMKKGELSMAWMLWALGPFGPWVVASGADLSMACSAAGPGDIGGKARSPQSIGPAGLIANTVAVKR